MNKGKKFITLFIIFFLLTLSGSLYAKERKHGANFVITKIDGQQIRGELIAVKDNTLLLLQESGIDVSIAIQNVKTITLVKRSVKKILTILIGAGSGFVAGAVVTCPPSMYHLQS